MFLCNPRDQVLLPFRFLESLEHVYVRGDQRHTGVSASVTCAPAPGPPVLKFKDAGGKLIRRSSCLLPYDAIVSWARDELFRL